MLTNSGRWGDNHVLPPEQFLVPPEQFLEKNFSADYVIPKYNNIKKIEQILQSPGNIALPVSHDRFVPDGNLVYGDGYFQTQEKLRIDEIMAEGEKIKAEQKLRIDEIMAEGEKMKAEQKLRIAAIIAEGEKMEAEQKLRIAAIIAEGEKMEAHGK